MNLLQVPSSVIGLMGAQPRQRNPMLGLFGSSQQGPDPYALQAMQAQQAQQIQQAQAAETQAPQAQAQSRPQISTGPAQRQRVSALGVLGRAFAPNISGALDSERARLQAEADAPAIRARREYLAGLAAEMGPQAELAFALNGGELGKAMASNLEGYTLSAGGVRGGPNGVIAGAPTTTVVNDQIYQNDPMTRTSRMIAQADPSFSNITARQVADANSVNQQGQLGVAQQNAETARMNADTTRQNSGFTVGQNQQRYDAAGNLIAAGPQGASQSQVKLAGPEAARVSKAAEIATAARSRINDARRFVELNRNNSTGLGAAILGPAAGLNPEYAEMRAISARLIPGEREPGSGPMSDKDAVMYKQAVVDIDKPGPTNQALANVVVAASERDIDYASFLEEYAQRNGNLLGANEDWQSYVNANPLFVEGGGGNTQVNPRLNKDWRGFMGWGERTRGSSSRGGSAGNNVRTPPPPPPRFQDRELGMAQDIIAVNDQTGERVRWDGNAWQPVGGSPARQSAPRQSAAPQPRQQYSGRMPLSADEIFGSLIAQESRGRAGAVGPDTRWGNALGRTQMLPDTARGVARNIGLPYREDLLRGASEEAAQYQDRLGRAYLQEGFQNTGNARDALMYYHGGPNRDQWGPKTRQYADDVLSKWASGDSIDPLDASLSGVAELTATPAQSGEMEVVESFPDQQASAANGTMAVDDAGNRVTYVDGAWLPTDKNGFILAAADDQWGTEQNPWTTDQLAMQIAERGVDGLEGDYTRYTNEAGENWLGRFAPGSVGLGDGIAQDGGVRVRETNPALNNAGAVINAWNEQIPFGDELSARLVSVLGDQSYEDIRGVQEAARNTENEISPLARDIGGVSGFASTVLMPMAGAGWVGQGANRAQQVLRGGMVAAPVGALYGAGATEDGLGNRAMGAAVGGATGFGGGAVGTAAVPFVAEVARRVGQGGMEAGRSLARALGRTDAQADRAVDDVVSGIQDTYTRATMPNERLDRVMSGAMPDGVRPAPQSPEMPRSTSQALDYITDLIERESVYGPPTAAVASRPRTAAEAIGRGAQASVTALARRPGTTGAAASRILGDRAANTPYRVVSDFADLTGMNPQGSADVIQNLAQTGRAKAGPLYDEAYARQFYITPNVQSILDTPSGKQAMSRAIRIIRDERKDPTALGFDFDEAGDVVHIRTPSVQSLDYVKRGFDSVLDDYRNPITRKLELTTASRPIVQLVSELREGLISGTGGEFGPYASALRAAGEPIRLEQAFGDAEKLFRNNTSLREFTTRLRDMGEAEQNALVAGMADKLYRDAEAGRLGVRALDQLRTPLMKGKLSEVLGDSGAEQFIQRITAEADLWRSGQRMAPGNNSITFEATAANDELNGVGGITEAAARNIGTMGPEAGLLKTALEAVYAPVAGFVRGVGDPRNQATRDKIGELLLSSPEELTALINADRARSTTPNVGPTSEALRRVAGVGGSQAAVASSPAGTRNSRRAGQR